ncbi:MAG: hypothetical protein H7175_24445, partial [Burkholderiales bacterium]|nr:hypothetical protein [Anaerolineae bacterium]
DDVVKLVDGGSYLPLRQIVDGLIAPQVACLDVALSRLPDPRYPVVQDSAGGRFMSAQSVYSDVAPQGGAIIYSVKFLDPRQPSDPKADERELETLLDTVQPGWRDVLVKRQYLPRMDALGTLPTARDGGFAGRPAPEVPGIDGLYMAGDWVGAEGFLVDASFASAKQVVAMVQRDLRRAPAQRQAVKFAV